MARKCRNQQVDHTAQANMIEEPLVAVLTEVTIVGGTDGWWVDTGASCHMSAMVVLCSKHTQMLIITKIAANYGNNSFCPDLVRYRARTNLW
ncbi:hypothetical protein Lal_00002394 [Lupinus albus]|nr:hypothetical protein Lal_00002394 [Lupinus albus]